MTKFSRKNNESKGLLYLINLGVSYKRVTQLRYFVAVFFATTMMYFSNSSKSEVDFVKSYTTFYFNPVVDVFYSPISFLKYLTNLTFDIIFVYKENKRLKEENLKMEEHILLRELKSHKDQENDYLLHANIGFDKHLKNFPISYISTNSGIAIVELNGFSVKENSSVLCGSGLAGRVVSSDDKIAKIILINDERSFLPVTTSATGVKGVLKSHFSGGVEIVNTETLPKIGEIVYTMSPDKAFLGGVPVGIIYKSDNDEVLVKPMCDPLKSNFFSIFVG